VYGDSAPDVVQLHEPIVGTAFWETVQRVGYGPIIVECKTRKHDFFPKYLILALKHFGPILNPIPAWLEEWIEQADGYHKSSKFFLAVKKKRGRGSGNGTINFVVFIDGTFPFNGITWGRLVLLPYEEFLEELTCL